MSTHGFNAGTNDRAGFRACSERSTQQGLWQVPRCTSRALPVHAAHHHAQGSPQTLQPVAGPLRQPAWRLAGTCTLPCSFGRAGTFNHGVCRCGRSQKGWGTRQQLPPLHGRWAASARCLRPMAARPGPCRARSCSSGLPPLPASLPPSLPPSGANVAAPPLLCSCHMDLRGRNCPGCVCGLR